MRTILILAAALGAGGCLADMPPLVRNHRVTTETQAADFHVLANPEGGAAWSVQITNNTDAIATVVWDESTFVTAGGASAGRLIAGGVMKIDATRAHPPTPIAPRARVTEWVVPESFIEDEETENWVKDRKERGANFRTDDVERVKKQRALRDARITGGKIYVTIQGPNGKQTWAGLVVESK